MSKQLSELCTVVIEEIFGQLPSLIFSTLATRGRLSLPYLLQFSKFTPTYLKHGLAVLIQHQLVSYHTSPDDDVTYYEAHVRNAYDLIRAGKHEQLTVSNFGEDCAAIVSIFRCDGFVNASDLKARLRDKGPTTTNSRDQDQAPPGNPSVDQKAQNYERNTKALEALFASKHIVKARGVDFITPHDFQDKVEDDLLQEKYPSGPKGKQKTELARSVLSRKRHLRDDNEASLELVQTYLRTQEKDSGHFPPSENADDEAPSNGPRKQRKLNGGRGYGLPNGWESNKGSEVIPRLDGPNSPKPTSANKRTKRRIEEVDDVETPPKKPAKSLKADHNVASTSTARKTPIKNKSRLRGHGRHEATEQEDESEGDKANGISHAEDPSAAYSLGNSNNDDHEDLSNDERASSIERSETNVSTETIKRRKGNGGPKGLAQAKPDGAVNSGEVVRDKKTQKAVTGSNHLAAGEAESTLYESIEEMDELSEENDELSFRLNLEKFDVSMRGQRLVELANQYLGEPTSKVYAALLRCLERKIARCHDPYAEDDEKPDDDEEGHDSEADEDDDEDEGDEHTASSIEIDAELDPNLDLGSTNEPERSSKDKVNGIANADSGNHNATSQSESPKRLSAIEEHLHLLAEHTHQFVHPLTLGGERHWHVDFHDLTSLLLQLELENAISSRFDLPSARIVGFLNAKGKLDEKRLADLTLIPQKDLRAKLTVLQEAGYVDLQEVPRDASRQPSRTIFLWYFDQERCRKLILDDTYKAMARLLQRCKFEKQKYKTVIAKSERTDVVGREDKYLSATEKEALKEWRRREEMIWIQVTRLDDMVALMRDFLPPKSS